jgi:hypothetical protein
MMLTTPAIASEPYWAEAPSRSTSMRSMAEAGIRSRSTGAPPRPTRARLLISAVPCRRLPLTRNRAWSPFRPRMVMARTVHEVPPPLMPGRLNDGIRVLSTSLRPTLPVAVSCSAEITSTGAGLSATVRRTPRTPVTITPSSAVAPSVSTAGAASTTGKAAGRSAARAGAARTETVRIEAQARSPVRKVVSSEGRARARVS